LLRDLCVHGNLRQRPAPADAPSTAQRRRPIGSTATFHAIAAIPTFLIPENSSTYIANLSRYAEHDLAITDGHINVTDTPGLGIEIQEADIAKLEFKPMLFREYRHADGSWKGR
jgi:hypothetical protein